ncbi:MAG: glutamine--fructose-6-phosphate transaminase (isomerizing) [Candidatus Kerfeldbacteria bacterium]|nr:glutamine--fructose-6-phosphate transaminase (isomerizing) [Candidatus Kerfeldbacteria bacterium]
MCGIIGYCGRNPALPYLVSGLKRIEYRGYDSAGVAILGNSPRLEIVKRRGKIAELERALAGMTLNGRLGISHTRWATHGEPSDVNAHPHTSCDGKIAVVHNGTIENFGPLRTMLEQEGHRFASQTDTEVLAHLLEKFTGEGINLLGAVQKMHALLEGAYGIAVVSCDEPERLVAARNGSPLVVGLADHGIFVASDATAFREHTNKVIYLEDGEMILIDGTAYQTLTLANKEIAKTVESLEWDLQEIAKGGYEHFMLKEIMEQPTTLAHTLAGRLTKGDQPRAHLGGVAKIEPFLRNRMERVIITACGTSWHAGLIGKRMIEKLLGIPVMVEYASEFATGHTPVDDHTLTIVITQSGETKDTIDAARRAKAAGSTIWDICNVVGSSITRIADSGVYLHVGPEIGVASTKAFTGQILALALTTLAFAEILPTSPITEKGRIDIARALRELPEQIRAVLDRADDVSAIAAVFQHHTNALYLGRGYNYPTALEGALKLKEISYIHAEGYPAGEMKHGPIALIDHDMPVIVIAPKESEDERTYEKVMSNVEEVAARGGRVVLIASEGDPHADILQTQGKVERILRIPETLAMFTPVLASVYLQLLAYSIAAARGCEIDQPRNLAKSVTVV